MADVANINGMMADLLKNEGGYVNNPNDSGGETNFGITVAVARANSFNGNMRDMKRADAESIYRSIYFTKPGFDRVFAVSPAVAAELFDTGVNMGPSVASTFLQRALSALNRNRQDYGDLVVDGSIGDATIAALTAFLAKRGHEGESVLLKALNCLQGARYIGLAERSTKNEAFLYGWLDNRVSMSL